MPTISVNGADLYYEERGEGTPLLCIHATASSAMMWEEAAGKLARFGRVITYDRRGCTRSQRPQPYLTTSHSEHADDAAALLDALAAAPAIVIGRSYGGEVATELARRHPDLVRALVLLEGTSLNLTPTGQKWSAELAERVLAAAARGTDPSAPLRANAAGEALLRSVLGDAVWEQVPDSLQRMFTDNGPAIVAELRGGDLQVDAAALAAIHTPTLLVAASDSPEVFRQATEAMAAAMPHARTTLVGGGHLIDPAGPAVLAFIREVLADGGAG